jgi:hypothetical protein
MRLPVICLLFLFPFGCFGQSGYNLNFKIKGLKDTTIYLGYYYGESNYIKDTAHVNSKGEFAFAGKQPLAHGAYFLVLDKTRLFEMFVISDIQKFSMATNTEDYVKNMVVTGDPDNKIFFENMLFNMERHKEADPFIKILQDTISTEDEKKKAQEGFSKINEKVFAYQSEVINKHPGTLTAKFLKANKPVNIPEPPKKPDGTIDSTFQLRWYRQHFFDNFDLADEAMIRMPRPMYQGKINEYLDQLFAPQPDSLEKAIEFLVDNAKKNEETYAYAVRICLIKFQNPEIMGLDEVYVDIFDKYFATGEMDFWANAQMKKMVKDQADRLRKSLIGQTGANLIMLDQDLKPRSMYDIKNKYTILFIFDPDCGHCKEETPRLVDFYNLNKKKFDVEIYAVSADTSMVKMRDFMREMKLGGITVNGPRTFLGSYQEQYDAITTPSLYILDSRKKIIGKKIPANKLEEFFTQYERIEKIRADRKM